jgi:YgiT-type zinc finger domain-containing protein
MVCDCCGRRGAKVRRRPRVYGKGAELFVVADVPIVVCPNCGEGYLKSGTLRELERLKLHRRSLKSRRSAPVINYV